MKSKDQNLLAEAYEKVLKEDSSLDQWHKAQMNKEGSSKSDNVGSELYKLYVELDPEAKTKSGALVSDVLKTILEELRDSVDMAQRYADQEPWEALQDLLNKLRLD